MKKIAVLTSSRADFGIYLPLLKQLKNVKYISVTLIAFGTHLSKKYGYTLDHILEEGFKVKYRVKTIPASDSPKGISASMGSTLISFSSFWEKHKDEFDLILCLGDRYEMFAAVYAAVPFNLRFAHIHGGETTLGAMDNAFRHAITSYATYHFTTHRFYTKRVADIIGSSRNCFTVGSLSLDNLKQLKLFSKNEFHAKYGIALEAPLLVTFHPETVNFKNNSAYVKELISALRNNKNQQIITMPNADTMGSLVRSELVKYAKGKNNVHIVESFGTRGYFSCLKYCSVVVGNSSSGIIEAASFGKYVINMGERQKGRLSGSNVLNVPIDSKKITRAFEKLSKMPELGKKNIYGRGDASAKIVKIIKNLF